MPRGKELQLGERRSASELDGRQLCLRACAAQTTLSPSDAVLCTVFKLYFSILGYGEESLADLESFSSVLAILGQNS